MSEIQVIATLYPAEGKADKLQEALDKMTRTVHEKEPDVLKYHLHRQTDAKGTPVFVMLETYRNEDALKAHSASAHMKELVETIGKESLLAKPLDIIRVTPVGGFSSRL